MLTKSLILAAAASALMAGAAMAQDLDKTTPAEIQDDAHSSLTVNPAPADSAATGTLSDTSTLAPGSLTIETVTNGPVPDTRENRAKYGMPDSHAGKMTAPRGN